MLRSAVTSIIGLTLGLSQHERQLAIVLTAEGRRAQLLDAIEALADAAERLP
jgi:hypothetical protein